MTPASPMKKQTGEWVALMGNPNSGKTALFNLLTGLNQKVSNYPGITVERKMGRAVLNDQCQVQVLDLPGTYSLTPESFDERIVSEEILSWLHGPARPRVIISVVDASNLERNLYLTSQLLDLNIPVIAALNMMDLVKQNGNLIAPQKLCEELGTAEVLHMSARKNWGVEELKEVIVRVINEPVHGKPDLPFALSGPVRSFLAHLTEFFKKEFGYNPRFAWAQALRIITRDSVLDGYLHSQVSGVKLDDKQIKDLQELRDTSISNLKSQGIQPQTLEATLRYRWLDSVLKKAGKLKVEILDRLTPSEKADKILTHPFLGPVIFIGLLTFMFQSIFTWATVPMDWITRGVAVFGEWILDALPTGILRDLIVEGIIGGVGAILIFLPQIMILVFFMTLLEDSGYMARVAFMLDRLMTKMGLHGRSVFPMMTGYACAIPGIMATRTIESWKERLVTILVLPLMSCSARLPVYALMIGAFIPHKKVLGLFDAQGLTLVIMYLMGTVTALVLAKIFSYFIHQKGQSSFIMEMPPYRFPLTRSVTRQVILRSKLFVINAGKIIMAISIVLWFLASYPKLEKTNENINPIHHSYAGKIGHAIEPFIKPLGFDWKIGIGLITSFAAREVMVTTLATIYNVEAGDKNVVLLTEALQEDKDPQTGELLYSPLVALSLMVFFVYAAQCMATFAIVRNETNSWKWPFFMIFYMTALAYLASLCVYQGGQLLGFS